MITRKIQNPENANGVVVAELARRNFRDFMEQAWGIVVELARAISASVCGSDSEHLQAISEEQIKHLLIN